MPKVHGLPLTLYDTHPGSSPGLDTNFLRITAMVAYTDIALESLVINLKTKLKSMTDARPSEIIAVKEKFVDDWKKIAARALDNISPEQKIAAFDKIAAGVIDLIETPQAWNEKDEDTDHYVFESVISGVFGPKIWNAVNELERLILGRF